MQRSTCSQLAIALASVLSTVLVANPARAQDTTASMGSRSGLGGASHRFEAMAPSLVKSAQIKPGDLVAIHGGPQMIPAMEALAVEVQKVGGNSLLLLETPKLLHSYFANVPDQYLGRTSAAWQDFQAQGIDVEFTLPSVENFQQTLADVPAERQAKVTAAFAAGQAALTERQNRNKTRRLNLIAPPSRTDVEQARIDSATYTRMYDQALAADYQAIARHGRAVQQALEGARRVHVTTPEGTDLTFSVQDRPIILDAGMVAPGSRGLLAARTGQMPGGAIRMAPVEGSVNGKIRAPSDQCDKAVKDEQIDVSGGMPKNVRAATDEACVQNAVKQAGRFGWVEIGLNPALRVTDPNASITSALLDLGAGAVTVNFGTNQDLGGENKTASGGWLIGLPRATVEADGKVVVRNGQLAM
jgi:aminopeptidase